MDDEYSIQIDNVQKALEIKNVSSKTMKMFESIIQNEEGKKRIYGLSFTVDMFKTETLEKVIERLYNEIIGTPLPALTTTPDSSENPNPSNEALHMKLDIPQQKELENILKKFFDKEVLSKGCLVSNPIFGKEKTVELCCKTVCEKIDSLVSTLEKFLTTKLKTETILSDTSLKNIAPELDGRYKVDDKDTSIFKYVLSCFVDKNMTIPELRKIKPKIQKLESFFGFEKTDFPTLDIQYGVKRDPAAIEEPYEIVTGGRARSRRKRSTSKNSRKSRGRGRRHRRSSHNKKRHTKRYRNRK